MIGSNETTVNSGALTGALVTIAWWVASSLYGVTPPPEVVAASMMIATALVQRIYPWRRS